MKYFPLLVLSGCLFWVTPASADLEWRVSVKFILNSSDNRPATGTVNTDAEVQAQIDNANQVLDALGRGYHYRLTEIVDLPNHTAWFNLDVCDNKDALDAAAKQNKSSWLYRDNAINIYINGHDSSGCCSFPAGGDVIFVGQGSRSTTLFHESGHYLNLCHAQGCPCGSCDSTKTGQCHTTPGNDDVDDTLPDLECWSQNQIADWTFNTTYANLSSGNKARVDNVFFNVMSYHDNRNRLTSDQLDRMTDASNGSRDNICNGRTVFVDRANDCLVPGGNSQCSVFGGPFPNFQGGVTAAGSGDTVLVRPGTYAETITISKRITLRATRGNPVIGAGAGGAAGGLQPAADPGVATPLDSGPFVPKNLPNNFDGRTGR